MLSTAHKCLTCGKPKGEHLASTDNCPFGKKTVIGYTNYHPSKVFVPDPKWVPKHHPFVL
jgi:hypothetical protein